MQKETLMEQFQKSSYLANNNAGYIEMLYENFLRDPNNVNKEWRHYFRSLSNNTAVLGISNSSIQKEFFELSSQKAYTIPNGKPTSTQTAVDLLIEAYRQFGHLNAKINPLGGGDRPIDPRLELNHYGLTKTDFKEKFTTNGFLDRSHVTLEEIYNRLREIYCGSIGVQFNTCSNEEERNWLQHYVEHQLSRIDFNKRNILQQLVAAETLEKYLDTKYVGQVRYSLEGGESLIPLLNELIKRACGKKLNEVVICMAHRGRVNVLLNIMGQSASELFQEFEGKKDYGLMSGDVKYHLGYSQDIKTDEGPMRLSLAFNPSHLEFICPVVMGYVRAQQEKQNRQNLDYAMAVMIHGDASFSGEGIVMEALNMSQTRAYYIGGSIHIVLNNQLGFTTSNPKDARSSLYCTDIAKMLDAPVFHVNGDDPEAVIAVTQLVLDYRMKFHKDVFIDLVCYRRHGHQEVDDPAPTQPVMYKIIQEHTTTRAMYAKRLINQQICTSEEVDEWTEKYRTRLDEGGQVVETLPDSVSVHYCAASSLTPCLGQECAVMMIDTAVSLKKLKAIGKKLATLPDTLKLHRKVAAIYKSRLEMARGKVPIDWGFGEMIAYASLLEEGHSVRLVGQDSRRGTFFHRHAAVFDQDTGKKYEPLKHLKAQQAKAYIYDSLLCETGALGFEYGYSTADSQSLIIWEAQFGDFSNVAQVIIDQFISSGWQKWNRLSDLVMFLPHGYEGKGPEHSSARLERYLQLCAQNNMQVCVPTTPAQIFHLLRHQVLCPYQKPLIVMTPKSLLRHKLAVSLLEDLTHGQLKLIIPEIDKQNPRKVKRVVLCSGKVYYELLIKRRENKNKLNDIALIRIEQLYPFPYDELKAELKKYSEAEKVIWCQEEPKNQGAWFYTRHRLAKCLLQDNQILDYAGRPASAAAATGYPALYLKSQKKLINKALGLKEEI